MRLQELDVSHAVATGAGLFGLWRTSAFADVDELDAWEDRVADDAALERSISAGDFVPLNVGGNGAFQVAVRGTDSPGNLSAREREYLVVSSDPYLLVSDGMLELGGLEGVGNYAGAPTVPIPLDSGRYGVVVHLLDWQAEPGGRDEDGSPSANALPDFAVEVFPDSGAITEYRGRVETFDRV